jgi:tetratricopeptide (TPR) repeat protein
VPEEALSLHQAGREAGAAGDYENAFALFSQAAALAPGWPYPVYDEAFTHLLMGDFAAALEDYRRTIALAPRGFFTARTAVDVLEREEAGELPVGIYLAYSQVGWIQDPTAKEARLRELLARAPAFAPGWKELATLLEDGAARLDAIERGLAAHPDPETRGILLINRAIVLFSQGNRDEAIAILGLLALDEEGSSSSAEQAKAALAMLLDQEAGQ